MGRSSLLRFYRPAAWLARRGPLAHGALLFGLLAGLSTPGRAAAAPADDWSLERTERDPTLVGQRLKKLRQRPFDAEQWAALRKALGAAGLAAHIEAELARNPNDVALRILDARAALLLERPAEAAVKLSLVDQAGSAGRFRAQVLALRIEALAQAGQFKDAIAELEDRATRETDPAAAHPLLEQAFALAERGGRRDDALRLAERLASDGDDADAQLRLARAAQAAGKHELADHAFARAIERTLGNPRSALGSRKGDELIAERAMARLDGDDPSGASALLWSLLEPPRRGTPHTRATLWERLAEAHRRDRSTDVLIDRLSRWLEQHPGEAAAWRTLAASQTVVGIDPTQALRNALTRAPRDTEIHVALIEALEARGDTETAVATFHELLRHNQSELQVGLDLATRLVSSGHHAEGLRLAHDIETQVGGRARGLMLLLDFYNLNDEPDAALTVAERLVAHHPRMPEARIALGEQLHQMGRTQDALTQWETLPRLIHPPHKGWARRAAVLSEHGHTTEAVTSVAHAMSLSPNQAEYTRLRAVLAEEQRRPPLALELWEKLRRSAGSSPEHELLRDEARTRVVELLVGGAIPKRRSKLDEAITDARERLDRGEPLGDAIEAGKLLAELYTRLENYPEAVHVQQRMLALVPDDPHRLEELAAAQRRAGQVDSALGTLEDLLQSEPDRTPDVLATMSELAFEAGDDERALEAATRAAAKDRQQIEALVRLGELYESRGDLEDAARAYGRALETTPSDPRARLHLAELELVRGDDGHAARLLRDVLERGGPPELVREAGMRALDLAETTGGLMELLSLAITRTARHPEADEPREFLLEALDRIAADDVKAWLTAADTDDRAQALRGPLVTVLTRGSVKARLRAAEHLGHLALPDTAVALVRLGSTLTAPRDATPTVREAFQLARLTAIRAAGRLRDPRAVSAFAALLADPHEHGDVRRTAAWALTWSGSSEGARVLATHLGNGVDPEIVSLACLALAGQPRAQVDPMHAQSTAVLARDDGNPHVRRACAFAEASLTPDRKLERMRLQLEASDPMLAAIAAWRIGTSEHPTEADLEALYRRVLGPNGLARDAAASALAGLLSARDRSGSTAPDAPADRASAAAWGLAIDRWLERRVAPEVPPLSPNDVQASLPQLRAAVAAVERGTRAERAALQRARDACSSASLQAADALCLSPLVDGPIVLADTREPAD